MNALRHVIYNPFISTTGLAAFVHSTWALATLFGGEAPPMALSLQFAYWLIPAMLIAFAMDVGQIATSAQIRAGSNHWAKYLTFGIFAIANYFLQWLYMAHHMPALALADGVRQQWQPLAQLIRDASLWIIPALLPLATWLYTVSDSEPAKQETRVIEIKPVLPSLPIAPNSEEFDGITEQADESYLAECSQCEWHGVYATPYQAKQARNAHLRSHKPVVSKNGHTEHA